MGVFFNMLGDGEASRAIAYALGKKIKAIDLKRCSSHDEVRILLADGFTLVLWDNLQLCCEQRYMNTDDDLQSIVGSKLKDILISDGPKETSRYSGVTEIQFLKIQTTKGEITMASYNEHNGYYSGFSLDARLEITK